MRATVRCMGRFPELVMGSRHQGGRLWERPILKIPPGEPLHNRRTGFGAEFRRRQPADGEVGAVGYS